MTIAIRTQIVLALASLSMAVAACDSKRIPPAPETLPPPKKPPPPPPKGSVKPPSPVETIALGMEDVGVRLADGTAWTWGHIGDAPEQRQPYPIKMPLDGAVKLTGGSMSGTLCGVFADGTGKCIQRSYNQGTKTWSWDESKQWGNPSATDGMRDIRAIAPSYVFDCAVVAKGGVRCWGEFRDRANDKDGAAHYTPVPIKGVKTAIDVGVGGSHACALLADHRVACWGDNDYDQLGVDSLDVRVRPSAAVVKGIDHVQQVAVGGSFNCALRDDGTVWCWGFGIMGQLGHGESVDIAKPTPIENLSDVVEVKAGDNGACARHKSGKVTCWGNDQTTRESNHPQLPHEIAGLDDATQLAVGDYNGCVVRATGVVSCWGDPTYGVNGDVSTTDVSDVHWLP